VHTYEYMYIYIRTYTLPWGKYRPMLLGKKFEEVKIKKGKCEKKVKMKMENNRVFKRGEKRAKRVYEE
jgi:hypothetical protein